jgi:hypothetical protein
MPGFDGNPDLYGIGKNLLIHLHVQQPLIDEFRDSNWLLHYCTILMDKSSMGPLRGALLTSHRNDLSRGDAGRCLGGLPGTARG